MIENDKSGDHPVVIYPPSYVGSSMYGNATSRRKIFLAGSIEMGTAVNWQDDVMGALGKYKCTVFNPRRADWDSSWSQNINSPNFYEQVSWELDHISKSDIIAFYFDGKTKSPISMLELGIASELAKNPYDQYKVTVCCPDEFWRKGNIDIVCQRSGIPVFTSMDTWLKDLQRLLKN